ncbi:hypothetical protein Sm713_69870 [Streptomyces sp. TS71-3]|nr:hypothetical protein Sm713_69870 [Streptomyces sp. TS71-3]
MYEVEPSPITLTFPSHGGVWRAAGVGGTGFRVAFAVSPAPAAAFPFAVSFAVVSPAVDGLWQPPTSSPASPVAATPQTAAARARRRAPGPPRAMCARRPRVVPASAWAGDVRVRVEGMAVS